MSANVPVRGDIWLADFNPARGHEQAGVRPALVVSADPFNQGPTQLVVLIPLSTTPRGVPLHVRILPPEGGVRRRSFIKCEDVRSVAQHRLISRWGAVSADTMAAVEDGLRILLQL